MRRKTTNATWISVVFVSVFWNPAHAQSPAGTAFTYQGRLMDAGVPGNGICDFRFALFDAPSGGTQQGSTINKTAVTLSNGLFTVTLDFGSGVFSGDARWLEMAVQCPGDSGFTTLSARQELLPTPNAIDAQTLGGRAPGYYLDLANQTGVLSVARGGTGAASADEARLALGAAASSVHHFSPWTRPTTTTIDSDGDVGPYSSITIGTDGHGLISYWDNANRDVKVAHCSDVPCTSATTSTIDGAGEVGWDISLAMGADGLGLISYVDGTNTDVKVAHCNDAACTSATTSIVDATGGTRTSVAIGADGLGLISYSGLRVAHCNDTACTSAAVSALDTSGSYTSVAIGVDGLGLISYAAGSVKVAHRDNTACSSAAISTIAGSGSYTSVAIGVDGLGLIGYYNTATGGLNVAHCSNVACTAATISTIDSSANVGSYTSATIGGDGLGLISSYDVTNGDLKVTHCSNAMCNPNVRRR